MATQRNNTEERLTWQMALPHLLDRLTTIDEQPLDEEQGSSMTSHASDRVQSDQSRQPPSRGSEPERTAAGEQHVLPGAERVSDVKVAKRRAGQAKQKPADEGLFSDESKQTDLVSQIRAAEASKPIEPDEFDRAFDAALDSIREKEALEELKALARRHWEEWLPEKVKELKADGRLDEELRAAASLAQAEIRHLMKYQGYQEHEAREVALPLFILLPPEGDGLDDEEREELAEKEREYRRNPPVYLDEGDPNE